MELGFLSIFSRRLVIPFLQVMSAVETKAPGTFTRGVREKFSDEKARFGVFGPSIWNFYCFDPFSEAFTRHLVVVKS